jgi:hypothetical protein
MALLEGGKLRSAEGGRILFFCPGCNHGHMINVGDSPGPRWGYNNNPVLPTFTPSILVSSGGYKDEDGEDIPRVTHCHSFVTDGKIQFLSDCEHSLKNQTVDIPLWPDHYGGP